MPKQREILNNNLGWRWSLYLTTIIKAALFVLMIPFLPETLYIRSNQEAAQTSSGLSDVPKNEQSRHPIRYNLTRNPFKSMGPSPTLNDFLRPFKMCKSVFQYLSFTLPMSITWIVRYPSVVLVALPISFGIAYSDVGLTSLIPQVFQPLYGFNSQQQGVLRLGILHVVWINVETGLTFIGFLIGSLIGETLAGGLSDLIVARRTKANKGAFEPEMRLAALPFSIFFLATGLLLWGIFVDIPTPWIGPVFVGGKFFQFKSWMMFECLFLLRRNYMRRPNGHYNRHGICDWLL